MAKKNMQDAQAKQKKYADVRRRYLSFKEGDYVHLRLHKNRYASLKGNTNTKLAHRYYGPYKNIHKVGEVAYELELPRTSRIHNVFHVSLLKPHVEQHVQVLPELPPMDEEGHIIYVPESIVGFRDHVLRNKVYVEYLIKWKGLCKTGLGWIFPYFTCSKLPPSLPQITCSCETSAS